MVKKASKKTQESLNYYKNLIGSTYSYITIIDFERRFDGYSRLRFKVKCICDKEFYPEVHNVINCKTTSCGCNRYERLVQIITLPNNEALINRIFAGYIAHAKDKNLPYELTKEYFGKLIFNQCYYCGCNPRVRNKISAKGKNISSFEYNGIDRMNNELGYTIDNCVTCCEICNFAKQSLTLNEFYSWIEKLAKKK